MTGVVTANHDKAGNMTFNSDNPSAILIGLPADLQPVPAFAKIAGRAFSLRGGDS